MFLQKLLSGRNSSKTKLELLAQSWSSIQKYYETAADALKDAVDLTPIPTALQNIVKLIQAEELEYERANDTLETGPCLEYLLQRRVLEELVEFAKVDTPFGMRIHCLRFFCSLVINVHAQLLPERAVHVPLQKLISSCHRLIAHHYEQLEIDPDACSEERHAAIAELSLELVKLMHGVFAHFKGTNAALMDLFFERGWCRGLGENVWRSSKDGKTSHKRRESLDEKIQWNMFLMPRFDMFTQLIDFMNVPGETGEIAREAILFALRLLEGDPEYVCYIVEYSGFCEVMAERLAVLFALLPKNNGAFTFSSNNRVVPVRPPKRRIQFSIPAMITNNSLMITVNAHNSFRRKRRKRSPFDTNFIRTLENIKEGELLLDHFYSFWEYLNDVARVADKRLMTALMAQLTTSLWHPVVCTALSSPNIDAATAATAYTTEMIRSLTDQTLLHAFLVVLVGEEGGVGKDLEPEMKSNNTSTFIGLDDDDDDNSSSSNYNNNEDEVDEEDVNSNNNNNINNNEEDNQSQQSNSKKRGHDNNNNENGSDKASLPRSSSEQRSLKSATGGVTIMDDDLTLRLLLIHRVNSDDMDLSLATLRLFDTVLETYNQFAIYNLVLRNFVDIGPDGEYLSSTLKITNNDTSLEKKNTSNQLEVENENEKDKDGEKKTATTTKSDDHDASKLQKENKKEKVRWLVERVLSLLPLEDELERMKSPALSAIIAQDKGQKLNHTANPMNNGQVVPGNSYDDYFHEARERFQYGILARNFWQFPYPPVKNKQDTDRESEDKKGRPKRPKSMVVGREAVRMMNDSMAHFGRSSSFSSNYSNHSDENDLIKKCESYEGLFLNRIFDLFSKMLEASMEQNLLVTSILQKIAGIVDRRVDGVICDWRTIRVGEDGSLYGGVWTLPTTTARARRSLYALLEQVTFEALKRAQLVPNFETRISLAKKKGINPLSPNQHDPYHHHSHQQEPIQQVLRSTANALQFTPSNQSSNTNQHRGLSKQPSLSQLMFHNKHHNSLPSPPLPTHSKSATTTSLSSISSSSASSSSSTSPPLPARLDLSASTLQNMNGNGNHHYDNLPSASSPSALFFQQKANATPVTMNNPFVNFPNFVHAYIVLQEFCKELAAVILVRHATEYPDEPFPLSASSSYNNNLSSLSNNHQQQQQHHHMGMTRQKMMAAWHHDQYYLPPSSSQQQQQISNHSYYYNNNASSPFSPIHSPIGFDMDTNKKWRNRMSVATMSTFDYRSQLDTIDESSRRLNNLRSPI